jgi:hypothetical protein
MSSSVADSKRIRNRGASFLDGASGPVPHTVCGSASKLLSTTDRIHTGEAQKPCPAASEASEDVQTWN